ncbi:prolipoprotein diacylglyceryl transferase family protein [uncultured Winogradskyella sp.]|uniref:prolipoprotein diacylglyceryl transferase n=1 Tax=uncultured Winogradskyella sp. TaxID=395353 RepID=UPI0026036667|nr:prolipoprotein diacylglyceryl transferase family protein [uncultured Winogradskyella sp.]
MLPELFHFELPELFNSLFSIKQITIYSYPFCILIACIIAYRFFIYAQNKCFGEIRLRLNFLFLLIFMAFIGGKLFLVFDNPMNYMSKVFTLVFYTSSGFVFYGSFISCLISILIVLYKKQLPIFKYLDIIAIVTTILHCIGRLGCFFAGCCYGVPTDSFLGVHFANNHTTKVHPTQLYEALFIGMLLICLLRTFKTKNNGTVFTIYIFSYACWRFMLEYLRGDQRGYVFNDMLSQSQLIALILILLFGTFLFVKNFIVKSTQ